LFFFLKTNLEWSKSNPNSHKRTLIKSRAVENFGELGEAGQGEGDVDGGVGCDKDELGVAELLWLEHNGVGEVAGDEHQRQD